jgi:hypothetical protein
MTTEQLQSILDAMASLKDMMELGVRCLFLMVGVLLHLVFQQIFKPWDVKR